MIRISPMTRFNIIFWFFTSLMLPFVIVIAITGALFGIYPRWRERAYSKTEILIDRMCVLRNRIPCIRNAYYRAHLFDMLKDPDGR